MACVWSGSASLAYYVSFSSAWSTAQVGQWTSDHLCTGQRALAAVARAVDGRGERTDLVEATCRHCNVTKAEDLLE